MVRPEEPIKPKKPDLTKAKNPKELTKKYKAANKIYKAAMVVYRDTILKIDQEEAAYNDALKKFKDAQSAYKKGLANFKDKEKKYVVSLKEYEKAAAAYQKMPEYKLELEGQKKFAKEESRDINRHVRLQEKEKQREASRMSVMSRRNFFAEKNFPGVLFMLLMRENIYKHFYRLKFASINFPFAQDLSEILIRRRARN